MGVLKFFRYLVKKYPDCLNRLYGTYENCEKASKYKINTDWLELDLNSIYHPVAQDLYQYGNKAPKVSLLRKTKAPPQIPEEKLFEAIANRIENIRKIIQPKIGIYFATDGVAGVSKVTQQRKRRFKGAGEKKKDGSKFDSNCISCGTMFMERLSDYMKNFIEEQLSTNDDWKDLQIIINNNRVTGEGEHKLLDHMRKNPHWSYTLVSPDADMIFLGMGAHNPNVYIFRENIFQDVLGEFFIVSVNDFRKSILKEINYFTSEASKDINKENAMIDDFIFMLFGVGNDFLPQIPTLDISNDGIETILQAYAKVIEKHGCLTTKINSEYTINKKSFKEFLKILADLEYQMLVNFKKSNNITFPDLLLDECCKYSFDEEKQKILTIDFEKYKSLYNTEKFQGINTKTIVHEYLKGMTFVLRYYLEKIPSYMWLYPFHYAPFFTELYEHIDSFEENIDFGNSFPLTQLEQLVSILPGNSNYLLPEKLRWLSTSLDSPIIDMFPIDFKKDLQGKKYEYEEIPSIPHIDPFRIRNAFQKIKLDKQDEERNKEGEVVVLFLEEDKETNEIIICEKKYE
jgi:5'-3' exonuclease